MSQTEVKNKVLEILESDYVGTLSTIKDNKPHSRFMTFFHEDLTLMTPTSRETHKVEDIKENHNVHVLLGYDGKGWNDRYIEVQGTVEIDDSKETKEKLWGDMLSKWFESPEDPNYIVLKITPETIRLMNEGENTPETLEL
ncbi:pyridoxamine 5'-phosphate oxidase family protein [Guptibacillus algicola]|uniref:pyridoxamine 5'-phosphate oxidase family protein n=1 Tax=Guptibacillus algicola TaxID=225844 RepID=UPI001CD4D868|nr:pyridoxamine 5'-phosphate oxidase family protein [Alkalihalobacillus algicola]MCA0989356.1 pyridoxamine 5'-phosphate oxidase family protein [Alkalihalobacillus algicola]